jgi:hypothetical protein
MRDASHSTRRQFIGVAGSLSLLLLLPRRLCAEDAVTFAVAVAGECVFVEAEQFADLGGWDLDQQSMDQMGSPYLIAHGLGIPVRDATTRVDFPIAGTYRLWVRTRDWVAPWKAPGGPGAFQVLVDGTATARTFGISGEDWHWQDGGLVEVGRNAVLGLHDLTGFEGRCEALLFCRNTDFTPTNHVPSLTAFRRELLGLPKEPGEGGSFDLVVVGGGIAGCCTALSAARNGLRVALLQDRPVLGGNGSSEVRVWPEGRTRLPPYPHIGEIVEELLPQRFPPGWQGSRNRREAINYGDADKLRLLQAEPRISLFLEQRVQAVDMVDGRIAAMVSQHTRTAVRMRIRGRLFCDCTGDAAVGFLAGADHEIHRGISMGMSNLWSTMDASSAEQVLKCDCKDKEALALALERGEKPAPFPRCPWAVDLGSRPFPGRGGRNREAPGGQLGDWMWESGFERDTILDVERIRDQNLRAMYGAWDAIKNVDKLYPNHRIGWSAFIAGKRESRRLLGDVILSDQDFLNGAVYPDGAFPCTWPIDLHAPDERFQAGFSGDEFIARATGHDADKARYTYQGPYWAPYRCLYSRNIPNLFMAGRDISVTHEGLGPVRVMRTCGMMGEVVGKAAAICIRSDCMPRDVYAHHLPKLQELMRQPGSSRMESAIRAH